MRHINWKIIITLVVVSILIIAGVVLYKKYAANSVSTDKLINVNNEIPDGYYSPKFVKHKKAEPQNKEEPTDEVEQPINAPSQQKTKKTFNFANAQQESEVELQRKAIIAQLNNINYNTKNNVITKKDYQIPEDYETPKQKTKDSYLYQKDFGLAKNEATKRVDLSRVIGVDNMFSALLITAVNSHLAGKVLALIEDDVYASQGRNILIPKGSKIVGWYLPLKKVGDERLPITWKIIRTPAGVNININADSADVMGRSGAMGELDNRFFDRYGSSLFFSTATNAVSYIALKSTRANDQGVETAEAESERELIKDYKDDLTSIVNQMLKEQMKIKPSINLDAGDRIFINPKSDIWFPQAENNNINISLANDIQSNKKEKN